MKGYKTSYWNRTSPRFPNWCLMVSFSVRFKSRYCISLCIERPTYSAIFHVRDGISATRPRFCVGRSTEFTPFMSKNVRMETTEIEKYTFSPRRQEQQNLTVQTQFFCETATMSDMKDMDKRWPINSVLESATHRFSSKTTSVQFHRPIRDGTVV